VPENRQDIAAKNSQPGLPYTTHYGISHYKWTPNGRRDGRYVAVPHCTVHRGAAAPAVVARDTRTTLVKEYLTGGRGHLIKAPQQGIKKSMRPGPGPGPGSGARETAPPANASPLVRAQALGPRTRSPDRGSCRHPGPCRNRTGEPCRGSFLVPLGLQIEGPWIRSLWKPLRNTARGLEVLADPGARVHLHGLADDEAVLRMRRPSRQVTL
jgi:hypothetical protein